MSLWRALRLSFVLFGLLLLASLAPAVGASPAYAPAGVANWTGEYYNSVDLSGPVATVRDDPSINFSWPEGTSPAPGFVGTSNYSVRWTRYIYFNTAGTWTFTTVNDDGMNVWVDDVITMNAWYDQGPTTHSGNINLTVGWHLVRVEYYNRTLGGTAIVNYSPAGSYPDWKGEYFNNQNLTAPALFTRNDAAVNFNWGTGNPGGGLPNDHFSVRWTRNLTLSAGTYRLTATSDDGVKVWLDGVLMIDGWYDHPPTTFLRDVSVGAGSHAFRVEYYENSYLASVQFSVAPVSSPPPPPPPGGWLGQYYPSVDFSVGPSFTRSDAAVNFNWGAGSPASGFPADNFSVKWDGTYNAPSFGNYNIQATSDDGVAVWVDGIKVLDGWYDHPPTTFSITRSLAAGAHAVHVEYYERGGGALITFSITPAGAPPPPPAGDVIVEDGGPGWQAGGCFSCWRNAGGSAGHSFWTLNNTTAVPGYNWARWFPNLPAARNYEVFAYIPAGIGNTTNARYWINHAGAYNLRSVNQGFFGNQWVSLGTYYFNGGAGENVSLTDVTYECYLCRTLVFDAIKFSPR